MSNITKDDATEEKNYAEELSEFQMRGLESEAFKAMRQAMTRFYWETRFCNLVLSGFKLSPDWTIPTAGAKLQKYGKGQIIYNPKFVLELTNDERDGLLKHEAYHIALGHCGDKWGHRANYNKSGWGPEKSKVSAVMVNWAMDLAINSFLKECEVPKWCLRPGRAPELHEDIEVDEYTLEQHKKVGAFLKNLPLNRSTEFYLGELMSNEELKEYIEKMQAMGVAKILFDEHEWDELDKMSADAVKGRIKKAIEKCNKDGSTAWGNTPIELRNELEMLYSNQVNWVDVLRQFVGFSRRAGRWTSQKRLNRKYPGIHPGIRRGYTSSVAVYLDQSGSVSDDEIKEFFGEISNLARHTEFTLFNFDCSVDESSERVWRRGKYGGQTRTRSGGTCFKSVKTHVEKNSNRFDACIILTDGYAPDPGPSKVRRAWVITKTGKLNFEHGRDVLVTMK